MRNSILVRSLSALTAALAACVLFGAARAAARSSSADEAAVRECVRQMESGWNARSGAQFAKPFAADADYVVINGMQLKGRAAIAQGHQQIFDTVYRDSNLALTLRQVRFLRADVAVAHVAARLKATLGQETRENEAVLTLVLTKEGGGWKIAAFQNTRVEAGR